MSKYLARLGILLTVLYLGFALWLVGGRLYMLPAMDLNAVGDFFAGIFGPLAILWLVLGFFQQGVELRQNNEALKLQAEELRNSVEQQRELVGVTAKQVGIELEKWQHERYVISESAKPVFNLALDSAVPLQGSEYWYQLILTNIGNFCQQVEVYLRMEEDEDLIRKKVTIKTGEEVSLELIVRGSGMLSRGHQVHIESVDSHGRVNAQVFDVESYIPVGEEHPKLLINKVYSQSSQDV
ncbi:hypothetical protein [Pseudomonas sp. USHLN015]|uniref:hypothetical protein n=1 Tax=Pseudomonas sp. USHLN015 TaxID=3081296 RepID=UPI00301B7F40